MMVYSESINLDHDDTTSAMFQLKEKVGEGKDMMFLESFTTFSYVEMAAKIKKFVKKEEMSNG